MAIESTNTQMDGDIMKRAIMSLSGGMDSTSLLINLLNDGFKVSCISYEYGQKHGIELDRAKKVDKKNSSKFILFPFCVDAEFWKLIKNINLSERKEILFVGNDGNRNPELFLEIVDRFKNIQFRAVTNIEEILLSLKIF